MTRATEAMRAANTKHGHARAGNPSKEYRAYHAMLKRCYDPKDKEYARYGGRGVWVYHEWTTSFAAFLRDVGLAPSAEHTLDRIDPEDNYGPANCRWATRLEQVRNRRNTQSYRGKPLAEWAQIHNLNYFTLMDRWRRGDRGEHLFRGVVCSARRLWTDDEILRIRSTSEDDGVTKGLASEFGCSIRTIQRIRNGQHFKSVVRR